MATTISKSPLQYQRMKALRERNPPGRARPLTGLPRYELKSTLTARRVDRKDDNRRYY